MKKTLLFGALLLIMISTALAVECDWGQTEVTNCDVTSNVSITGDHYVANVTLYGPATLDMNNVNIYWNNSWGYVLHSEGTNLFFAIAGDDVTIDGHGTTTIDGIVGHDGPGDCDDSYGTTAFEVWGTVSNPVIKNIEFVHNLAPIKYYWQTMNGVIEGNSLDSTVVPGESACHPMIYGTGNYTLIKDNSIAGSIALFGGRADIINNHDLYLDDYSGDYQHFSIRNQQAHEGDNKYWYGGQISGNDFINSLRLVYVVTSDSIINISGNDYIDYIYVDMGDGTQFKDGNTFIYNNAFGYIDDGLDYGSGQYITYCVDGIGNDRGDYGGGDTLQGSCTALWEVCGETLTDGCHLRENMTLLPYTFNLPKGIVIDGDGVTLDCNGALIKGNYGEDHGQTVGIHVLGQGVTVKNCRVTDYMYEPGGWWGFGAGIVVDANDVVIDSNYMNNNGWNFVVNDGTTNTQVINNEEGDKCTANYWTGTNIWDNTGHWCFHLPMQGSYAENNIIRTGTMIWYSDNVFTRNSVGGLVEFGTWPGGANDNSIFTYNNFKNGEMYVGESTTGVQIYGNTFENFKITQELDLVSWCVDGVGNTFLGTSTYSGVNENRATCEGMPGPGEGSAGSSSGHQQIINPRSNYYETSKPEQKGSTFSLFPGENFNLLQWIDSIIMTIRRAVGLEG